MNQVVKDFAEQRVPLNYAQLILLIFFIVSATFTLTTIYARFQSVETEVRVLNDKIDTVDSRVTKITKRNADEIKQLKK